MANSSCHPCYGGDLQIWTKVIAIIQIVFKSVSLGVSTIALIGLLVQWHGVNNANASDNVNSTWLLFLQISSAMEQNDSNNHSHSFLSPPQKQLNKKVVYGVAVMILVLIIIATIVSLVMSFFLFTGASKRDRKKIRLWLIVSFVVFAISMVNTIYVLFNPKVSPYQKIGNVIDLTFQIYITWVVYCFYGQLVSQIPSQFLAKF